MSRPIPTGERMYSHRMSSICAEPLSEQPVPHNAAAPSKTVIDRKVP